MIFKTEIKNTTLMLALGSGLLYLHGSAFHSGYLKGFGIHDKLFPLGLQETLVYGCRAYSNLGLKSFTPILYVLMVAIVFCLSAIYLSRFAWAKKIEGIIFEKVDPNKAEKINPVNYLVNFLWIGIGVVLPIIAVAIIYVLADAVGYEKGAADKNEMEMLMVEEKNWDSDFPKMAMEYLDVKSNQIQVVVGIVIESSADYMAMMTSKDMLIVRKDSIKELKSGKR